MEIQESLSKTGVLCRVLAYLASVAATPVKISLNISFSNLMPVKILDKILLGLMPYMSVMPTLLVGATVKGNPNYMTAAWATVAAWRPRWSV